MNSSLEAIISTWKRAMEGIGLIDAEPKKAVYIAGKITGDPDYKDKFNEAQSKLEDDGYIVINPAMLPMGLKYSLYYPINRAMIDACDTVYFLRDWYISPGAKAEMQYALENGKEIVVQG